MPTPLLALTHQTLAGPLPLQDGLSVSNSINLKVHKFTDAASGAPFPAATFPAVPEAHSSCWQLFFGASAAGLPDAWQPLDTLPAKVVVPASSIVVLLSLQLSRLAPFTRLIRFAKGKWRAWSCKQGEEKAFHCKWDPLSPDCQHALNVELRGAAPHLRSPLGKIDEAGILESEPATVGDLRIKGTGRKSSNLYRLEHQDTCDAMKAAMARQWDLAEQLVTTNRHLQGSALVATRSELRERLPGSRPITAAEGAVYERAVRSPGFDGALSQQRDKWMPQFRQDFTGANAGQPRAAIAAAARDGLEQCFTSAGAEPGARGESKPLGAAQAPDSPPKAAVAAVLTVAALRARGEENRQTSAISRWLRSMDPNAVGECTTARDEPRMVAALPKINEQADGMEFKESDVAVPVVAVRPLSKSALYVRGLSVCRHSQTRKGVEKHYRVDHALAVTDALQDPGAGPSFVTTGFLQIMPADTCVLWKQDVDVGPVVGPNNEPITMRGTATLVFDISGTKFKQDFTVGEGAPLLLLGNDLSDAYKAKIEMNVDGRGTAITSLTTVSGVKQVTLSTEPFSTAVVASLGHPVDASAAVEPKISDLGATGKTAGEYTIEPLPGAPFPCAKAEGAVDAAIKAESNSAKYFLYTGAAVHIPAGAKATVWMAMPRDLPADKMETCFVGSLPKQDGIGPDPPFVIPGLEKPDARGLIKVVVWNRRARDRSLPAFSPVAELEVGWDVIKPEELAPDHDYLAALSEEHLALLDSIEFDTARRLSPEKRLRVRQLLAKRIRAFALDPKDPGKTHAMKVELPLKEGARPHCHAPSKLGEAGREFITKEVAKLEAANIIRKSNSEWNNRIVLVGKKDAEGNKTDVRMCIDFRDLNSKLVTLDTPLPLTIDALERLAGGADSRGSADSLYVSTLDLASGFYCLPLAENDKKLTAFSNGHLKYEWNYLPFGIASGPSYMCRLMDAALDGLAWDICYPYLDDCGVFSTGEGSTQQERDDASFEHMLVRIDLVLQRFESAGMTCKASKCKLFQTSAEYLGHLITREGIRMDPKKIAAVAEVDPKGLNTLEKIRSFLGLCSYYRRFIAGYSRIAAPFHDLTKKEIDVEQEVQSEKCQDAIKALKKAITDEPVLMAPKFDRMFTVKTDAAGTEGLGGILTQLDDEGHERVVAYYGRKLNKHERNYTVTEIECLAAVNSIKQWRPYLWGRKFHLVVDHSALRWLHTMKDTIDGGPASRLMRWILKLQEYNFTVEHKPGAAHKDADGVSRIMSDDVLRLSAMRVLAVLRTSEAGEAHRRQRKPLADQVEALVNKRTQFRDLLAQCDEPQILAAMRVATDTTQQGSSRSPVATARRLQAKERAERNASYSRQAVLERYLRTGAPDPNVLADNQHEDEECQHLMAKLEHGDLVSTGPVESAYARWIAKEARQMEMVDGVLCKRNLASGDEGDTQLEATDFVIHLPYVPREMRWSMLTAFHDRLGHPGVNRMRALLKPRYYWPGMQQDVHQYVSECHECTLSKRATRRAANPRGPPIGSYPFDLLYCDVLDMADTHDYVKGERGYRKLLVFIDSLSRWVEAIPFNSDPTSKQVLDAFLTQIVCRYGTPRGIATDDGSNISSELCKTILAETGVDLSSTPANTHDAVGLVERVNQTLIGMCRAADEGGEYWADHLPFLLMSYHATPHRLTEMSPTALVFGREMRLPAQMCAPGSTAAPLAAVDSDEVAAANGDQTKSLTKNAKEAVMQYALRLHSHLYYAWSAARAITGEAQGAAVANTHSRTREVQYEVNDRVVRALYDDANKLQYGHAGPYRVKEVLANGRYVLQDFENQMLNEEFDSHSLKPYLTWVDEQELTSDEYIVERLIQHRGDGHSREFLVKWRQYPISKATWEPKRELMRRSASLVVQYESELAHASQAATEHDKERTKAKSNVKEQEKPATQPEPKQHKQPEAYVSDDLPCMATFSKGAWRYGRNVATPRGLKLRMFQPSAFSDDELQLEHFVSLRDAFMEQQDKGATAPRQVIAALKYLAQLREHLWIKW